MNRSEQINELAAALCKAQGAIEGAKKDSVNPHFKSAYADLASVWEAVRKPLTDNGLAITQWPRTVENGVEVETVLMHVSGQFMSDVLWLPILKMDAQAVGSATSYGRRYALMAALGVASIDDDANGAGQHKPGAPGTAGAGTDFRPDGPRRMPTKNYAEDARHDGTLDTTRQKGTLPGKTNGNGDALKKIEWARKAREMFKLAQTEDELNDWWRTEKERIGIIETAIPSEYDALLADFDAARDRIRARA